MPKPSSDDYMPVVNATARRKSADKNQGMYQPEYIEDMKKYYKYQQQRESGNGEPDRYGLYHTAHGKPVSMGINMNNPYAYRGPDVRAQLGQIPIHMQNVYGQNYDNHPLNISPAQYSYQGAPYYYPSQSKVVNKVMGALNKPSEYMQMLIDYIKSRYRR